jgi:hypothetical protein
MDRDCSKEGRAQTATTNHFPQPTVEIGLISLGLRGLGTWGHATWGPGIKHEWRRSMISITATTTIVINNSISSSSIIQQQ